MPRRWLRLKRGSPIPRARRLRRGPSFRLVQKRTLRRRAGLQPATPASLPANFNGCGKNCFVGQALSPAKALIPKRQAEPPAPPRPPRLQWRFMVGAGGSLIAAAGGAAAASGFLAWAVRGRSAQVFGRSVWRGPRGRRAVALTFDDGPSEATPATARDSGSPQHAGHVFPVRGQRGAAARGGPRGGRPRARDWKPRLLAYALLFPFGAIHGRGVAPGAVRHRGARGHTPGLVPRPLWRALVRPGFRPEAAGTDRRHVERNRL